MGCGPHRAEIPREKIRYSAGEVATIVPQSNDRLGEIALIAEDGERGRLKVEITAERAIDAQPARGKHAQQMSAGEHEYIGADRAKARNYAIGASGDLRQRLPARTPVAEDLPLGTLAANLRGPLAFIGAVIPLDEIRIDACDRAKARQRARSARTFERTRDHARGLQSRQAL